MLGNLLFENMTEGTGFSNCKTMSIFQDAKGFIWFGGSQGLLRFDGYNFKPFYFDIYGERNNYFFVNCIAETSPGKILFSTVGYPLIEFDIENEIFRDIKISQDNEQLYPMSIIGDCHENLWIGSQQGLNILNLRDGNISKYRKSEEFNRETVNCNYITSLHFEEETDHIIIGTAGGGINIYNVKTGYFAFLTADEKSENSPDSNKINCIFKDSYSNFWFGTNKGLNKYNYKNGNFVKVNINDHIENHFSEYVINTICEDSNGMIWLGTRKSGLIYFDPHKNEFKSFLHNKNNNQGICHNDILTLFTDKTNNIWIGTDYGGIGKTDMEQKKFKTISYDSFDNLNISNSVVTSIYSESEKSIWLGNYGGGLIECQRNNNKDFELFSIKELEDKNISSIVKGNGDNLIITGGGFGVCCFNLIDRKVKFMDPEILKEYVGLTYIYVCCQSFDKENKDFVWLGTGNGGIIKFDLKEEKIINVVKIRKILRNKTINCMHTDTKGVLWIGTNESGLYKYNEKIDEVQNFLLNINNSRNSISTIEEDSNYNIWVGSGYDGIHVIENNSSDLREISLGDKFLPHVFGILFEDKNICWVANIGLLRFDLVKKSLDKFLKSDGLWRDEFIENSNFLSPEGTMYFGSVGGITYFNPEDITTNNHIPNIALTDFQIFYESVIPGTENPFIKKSISYTKEITLTYKESVITFEFAALIYNNPKKNEYAYKMEGFDEDWVYCGTRRTATYTNLNPGEYTFRVKGSNNDGLWNEEGTSIKITITPPWYKTIIFKGLVGLSLIGSIGSFYRKRIHKLYKEKKQQEDFTKKLIESQENERKRVAAELHDSLGQDLLIIKNKLLMNIKKTDDENYKEQLQEISELTSFTLDDVREISYNLRPYELDRLGLTKTITSMIGRANSSTNINFTGIIDDIDRLFSTETETNIYRIIQECLNNVIKHSKAKEVIVNILKKENEIRINISDEGIGFDIRKFKQNTNRNGFGLKGIEERVRMLNGEFNIDSAAGKGTVLNIQLTVRR